VALITGGSGGIGRAVAERLAKDGMAIGVHYAGNKAKAEETVAAITAAGGKAIAVGGDVADENEMSAAFDAVEREFGGIDVVVNTAGIMVLSPIATLNLDDLDRMHRTNIRGTFVVSQQAARRVRRGGAIINLSTSVTRLQFPTYGAYAASKSPTEAFTPEQLAALAPEDADASQVSDEITRIVALPAGQRPYRVHIDPANDGSEEVSDVADRIRREFLTRVDLADLLTPRPPTA
jgi:3-oxoacyl-[acyl-carrier protein] reductase